MLIAETINRCLAFFDIKGTAGLVSFDQHKQIPIGRGVYVITSATTVIYVGKGAIKDRQPKHWQKALNDFKPGTRDTKGWAWLRENHEIDVNNWTVYYILLNKETELSAMEGALMHFLQPLANDETLMDRL